MAIVGAGIAGLATAYYLRSGGQPEVTLYEAGGRAGGHIVSEAVDGFLLEGGPDCFVSQKPWGLQLARALGLGETLTNTAPAGATYVLSDGKLHALPEGTMLMVPTRFLPLTRSRFLSWPGKLRMGLDLVLPRGGGEDESLGEFVGRRLGREALEKIAEPLVAGVHAGDPDRLSLRATFPRFKEMEERDRSLILAMIKARRRRAAAARARPEVASSSPTAFVTLAGGLESFVTRLISLLPEGSLQLESEVLTVEGLSGAYRLQVRRRGRGEPARDELTWEGPFDAVVLAVPAEQAARLLAGLVPEIARELAAMQTVSAVTVSLAWPCAKVRHPLNGFGLVIPRLEKRRVMGVTWTSSKFPGRAPSGHVLVRAFLGGVKGPEILSLSDEEVEGLVRRELAELLGVTAPPLLSRVYRWPGAMPQYNIGHLARLELIEERLRAHPGLALAGGSHRGIGIPDCIKSGLDAAARVS